MRINKYSSILYKRLHGAIRLADLAPDAVGGAQAEREELRRLREEVEAAGREVEERQEAARRREEERDLQLLEEESACLGRRSSGRVRESM